MYKSLKNLLGEGRLVLPKDCRWRSLTTKELKELLLLETGKTLKIDHPTHSSSSKDIADCIASISWLAISENLIVNSSANSALHPFGTPKSNGVKPIVSLDVFNQANPLSAKGRYNNKKSSLANIKRYF